MSPERQSTLRHDDQCHVREPAAASSSPGVFVVTTRPERLSILVLFGWELRCLAYRPRQSAPKQLLNFDLTERFGAYLYLLGSL